MRRRTWCKLVALVITLVLIVPMLAACGGGKEKVTPTDESIDWAKSIQTAGMAYYADIHQNPSVIKTTSTRGHWWPTYSGKSNDQLDPLTDTVLTDGMVAPDFTIAAIRNKSAVICMGLLTNSGASSENLIGAYLDIPNSAAPANGYDSVSTYAGVLTLNGSHIWYVTEGGKVRSAYIDAAGRLRLETLETVATPTMNATSQPTKTGKVTKKQPADLVLQVSDLPKNYSIKDSGPLLSSDVDQEAIDLGWQGGYKVIFEGTDADNNVVTQVTQYISILPPENTSKLLATSTVSSEQSKMNAWLKEQGSSLGITAITVEQMTNPTIGDGSRAWRLTVTDSSGDSLHFYTIEFTKLNIYELLEMRGTSTDYNMLTGLAKTAANKITS